MRAFLFMSKKPKDIFLQHLKEYVIKKKIKQDKAYSKSIVKKTIGGKDIFKSAKERKEERRDNRKKKSKGYNEKTDWYEFWLSMSETQKEQFLKWFTKKISFQSALGKRPWTTSQGLSFLYRRMEDLSASYFNKQGRLTKQQWDFVREMSEFFGDIFGRAQLATTLQQKKEIMTGWMRPNKPSGWIIRFRYEGEKGKDGKGLLRVLMKRGKGVYTFFNFPYVIYVLLTYLKTSLGEYWWKKWLWKYSDNPSKYRKFGYKRNAEKLEKFLGARNG